MCHEIRNTYASMELFSTKKFFNVYMQSGPQDCPSIITEVIHCIVDIEVSNGYGWKRFLLSSTRRHFIRALGKDL